MLEKLYSKVNQFILDGIIVSISFLLAYQVRYDEAVPAYQLHQCWILLGPITAARLLSYFAFGVERIPWRYFSLSDVFRIVRSMLPLTALLFALRYVPPSGRAIGKLPSGVIAVEFLLSLAGALSVRLLRRYLFEREEAQDNGNGARPRRLLLVGAGIIGARVAKEMSSNPAVHVVGFLDDDPRKKGCIISGAKVLGATGTLADFVRKRAVDDILVCTPRKSRASFNRFAALLENLPIKSKFMPTVDEIIESEDGLHLSVGNGNGNGKSNGHKSPQPQSDSEHSKHSTKSEIRNKRIVITGGAGFIGSHLAERLAENNEIVLVDRMLGGQPVQFASLPRNRVSLVEADILDDHRIAPLVRDADVVGHAAAIVGVGRVCSYPRETLETNFSGTSKILKALQNNSRLQRFVYFSTSEVFGVNSFRVHEDAPSWVGPAAQARWSYAIAKLAGEHLVQAYYRQEGTPVVTIRPFNVFGPRRLGAHAIKSFILSALTGQPIEVHGDGSQIRSWCFVSDLCDALVEMIARPEAVGQDFTIGNPANTVTVLQLAQQIVEMTGCKVPINRSAHPFPDIEIRGPSLTKANSILGYTPSYDLSHALEPTMDWDQQHLACFEAHLVEVTA